MLWNASSLIGYGIEATDGEIGSIDNLLFDDRNWIVRWLVIDTGTWLPGRRVLLPPSAAAAPDVRGAVLPVRLTRAQVETSPNLDTDAPVSRQHEAALYSHYGWEPYWLGGYPPLGGIASPVQPPLYTAGSKPGVLVDKTDDGDPHLRATREVAGSYVEASDGDIGHIEEFLLDADEWEIRYAVIDTRNWWPGKRVLISPHWLSSIDWSEHRVHIDLMRERIKAGPEYDPSRTVDRAYEQRLYQHYGYEGYWL
jgi:hypothetical protein